MNTQLNGTSGFDSGQQITGEHLTTKELSPEQDSLLTVVVQSAYSGYFNSTSNSIGDTPLEPHVVGTVKTTLEAKRYCGKICKEDYILLVKGIIPKLNQIKAKPLEM